MTQIIVAWRVSRPVSDDAPDVPEYHEEQLTPAELKQLMKDLATTVKYHGKEQALEAHLNLPLLGPQGLARSVCY